MGESHDELLEVDLAVAVVVEYVDHSPVKTFVIITSIVSEIISYMIYHMITEQGGFAATQAMT